MDQINHNGGENALAKAVLSRQTTAQEPSVIRSEVLYDEERESRKMKTAKRGHETLKIYVRSKKVAVRSVVLENYVGSIVGPVKLPTRFVEYEDALDETQKTMIDYAEDLALSAGLSIKVVDVSKQNLVMRFARLVFRRVRETPSIILPEAMFLHPLECDPPNLLEHMRLLPK